MGVFLSGLLGFVPALLRCRSKILFKLSDSDNEPVDAECPELGENTSEDLEQFCLYREDGGHCTALGQKCVLTHTDD